MSKLNEWLLSSKYLPEFMRDFHDQKNLFKFIHATYAETSGDVPKEIPDWVSSHIYTIDWFLWFMAGRGYTLQKTRTKLEFKPLPEYRQPVLQMESPKPKYILESTANQMVIDALEEVEDSLYRGHLDHYTPHMICIPNDKWTEIFKLIEKLKHKGE